MGCSGRGRTSETTNSRELVVAEVRDDISVAFHDIYNLDLGIKIAKEDHIIAIREAADVREQFGAQSTEGSR
jgi:hypothetical protein